MGRKTSLVTYPLSSSSRRPLTASPQLKNTHSHKCNLSYRQGLGVCASVPAAPTRVKTPAASPTRCVASALFRGSHTQLIVRDISSSRAVQSDLQALYQRAASPDRPPADQRKSPSHSSTMQAVASSQISGRGLGVVRPVTAVSVNAGDLCRPLSSSRRAMAVPATAAVAAGPVPQRQRQQRRPRVAARVAAEEAPAAAPAAAPAPALADIVSSADPARGARLGPLGSEGMTCLPPSIAAAPCPSHPSPC